MGKESNLSNRFYINNGWKFSEKYDEEMIKSGYDDSQVSYKVMEEE